MGLGVTFAFLGTSVHAACTRQSGDLYVLGRASGSPGRACTGHSRSAGHSGPGGRSSTAGRTGRTGSGLGTAQDSRFATTAAATAGRRATAASQRCAPATGVGPHRRRAGVCATVTSNRCAAAGVDGAA